MESVDTCTGLLPEYKPRYVMGVVSHCAMSSKGILTVIQGYQEDLIVGVALGADMFDCVWPTRTAVSILSPVLKTMLTPKSALVLHWFPRETSTLDTLHLRMISGL